MPVGPAKMPLFDHLSELRRRLTIIVVCILVTAVVIYAATPTLIQLLIDPIREFIPNNGQLYITTALGGFTLRFKVSMFFAVIVCCPIIIFQTLGFFMPALRPNEQRWVVPTVTALVFLFFFGMVFCYLVILNATFGWMLDQTTDFGAIFANAEDYINIIMLLELGFGAAFELPLVIFYLSIFHVVPYKTFREGWRGIYVGLLAGSAVVTPDASPVTMFLMFGAVVILYEISLFVARRVLIARDGKASLKWTREEYEEHKLED
ncbi:twin-arginine translocase subunit TatC [Olsenella uli]|uniref:twin-arginine translocase subunit TatC n=1 Tax=Olsenella uli TaxID=133926 RepID=UPI0012AB7026|nr:twin-arginine translocase subunit TatC [Olsenella uli]